MCAVVRQTRALCPKSSWSALPTSQARTRAANRSCNRRYSWRDSHCSSRIGMHSPTSRRLQQRQTSCCKDGLRLSLLRLNNHLQGAKLSLSMTSSR